MHLLKRALITHLKTDEASTKVFIEYADFAVVFSLKLAAELPKYTAINNDTYKLGDAQ